MSDESAESKKWTGVVAVVVTIGAAVFIYRQSQPNLGNVPQINMTREEIERGAMGGPAAVPTTASDASEPKVATPRKGGSPSP